MLNNINTLTIILISILVLMLTLLIVLVLVFVVSKRKKVTPRQGQLKELEDKGEKRKKRVIPKEYNAESIFDFMAFDKIEDNMICQLNGEKYLMVVECQGINYDLMSQVEKTSVEEGFIQFLNSLTHPVQIYTQTRTINLENSITSYKEQVKQVEIKYERQKKQYEAMLESGKYTKEQIEKVYFELTKQANLYEYGKDIVYNTEKMSLNKNVLDKKYYVIIPYYPAELGPNNFDKEEIKNLAFSELYTRSQSIIRTLGVCGISGKILTSLELVDLLYVAYNRDDAEVFGIDKAIQAGFDELYSTAPDVLDKKMQLLDEEIENKAIEKANKKIYETRSEKEMQIAEKEESIDEIVNNLAMLLIDENESIIGEDIARGAKEKIKKEKEGGTQDVPKEKKTRKRKSTKSA